MTEPLSKPGIRRKALLGAAGLLGAWALARLAGADRIPGPDAVTIPLISLTPYVAALAPLPLVAAALLRDRRAILASGLVVAGFAVILAPRVLGGGQPAARGPELRVVTANLMFGRASAAEIVRIVRAEKADVLSVQEFTPDAREALAAAGLDALLPYDLLDAREGAAGSGIYSRYRLTALPPVAGTIMAMPRAVLNVDGRSVQVTAVHPNPPLGPNLGDWKRTFAGLPDGDRDGAVHVLAGDFNATLDHARFRELLATGYADAADRAGSGLTPTWGVSMHGPPLTLDHVLVPSGAAVRSYRVHPLPGSDHRAVAVTVRLP